MTRNVAAHSLEDHVQGGGRGVAIMILAMTPIMGAVLISLQTQGGLPMIILTALVFVSLAAGWRRRPNAENSSARAAAYRIFAVLVLAGAMYMAVASDQTRYALWHPQTFEHWSIILWGLAIYAFFLPTVIGAETASGTMKTNE